MDTDDFMIELHEKLGQGMHLLLLHGLYFVIVGTFEVNYMDDVGQTLLNWASAFGTLEMVWFVTFPVKFLHF